MSRHALQMDIQSQLWPFAPLLDKDFSWLSILETKQCREQSSPGSLEMTICDGFLMFIDRVWIPDANNLHLRISIVGHCGIGGHLCLEGTRRRTSEYFFVESFEEDFKSFCGSNLDCRVSDKPFIPRPLGEDIYGTAPNQVVHYDFLHIQKSFKSSNHPFEYVLVLKDWFSGFLGLIPATIGGHVAVADASCNGIQGPCL